jgi:hypothetical protein
MWINKSSKYKLKIKVDWNKFKYGKTNLKKNNYSLLKNKNNIWNK